VTAAQAPEREQGPRHSRQFFCFLRGCIFVESHEKVPDPRLAHRPPPAADAPATTPHRRPGAGLLPEARLHPELLRVEGRVLDALLPHLLEEWVLRRDLRFLFDNYHIHALCDDSHRHNDDCDTQLRCEHQLPAGLVVRECEQGVQDVFSSLIQPLRRTFLPHVLAHGSVRSDVRVLHDEHEDDDHD